MKRTFGILSLVCLLGGAVFVLRGNLHEAKAQVAYENKGVDEGYNNDPYDFRGCVWGQEGDRRNIPEVTEEGDINYHVEEKQAPDEFYITVDKPLSDPCKTWSYLDNFDPTNYTPGRDEPEKYLIVGSGSAEFKSLKDKGEAALWPPGCFNPMNMYNFFSGVWQGAYGAFEINKNYNTWDKFYYAAMGVTNKRSSPGNIDLTMSNKSPSYGSEFSVNATPKSFSSPMNRMLYGWATQLPDQSYVSQQGLAAGGRMLSVGDQQDIPFPAGQDTNLDTCKRITRKVSASNDSDRDGMDDNWERRYAPNGDITQFKPEDDPDKDGVNITDPSFLAQENKPLLNDDDQPIVPPDVYNGIHVTPDTTAASRPGDGKFTNMEEFIWGTNPLDPDTDDDGLPDEADIVGLGQSEFKEISPVGQGGTLTNRMNIRATTVGISKLVDEKNSGHRKVFIDSDAVTVIPGIESDLQASLFNINETPQATNVTGTSTLNQGQDVFVEADATQSQGDRSVLLYTWFVEFRNSGSLDASERVQVPPTPEFTLAEAQQDIGRMGRFTFRHPLTELTQYVPSGYRFDSKPGSIIYVTVEISNTVTHEFSQKRIPISIGSDKTLGINITDLNTGSTLSIEDYVASYCYEATKNQVPEPAFCQFGGKSYNEVLPWIVFQGSRVEVVAQPIQAENKNVVYEWWVNEEKVIEPASDVNDNKLVIYPDSGTKNYEVMVKAYTKDEYRNEVFSGSVVMSVEGPQAAIVYTPDEPLAGSQVQLNGQLLNFPENYVASYNWTVRLPNDTEQTLTGKSVTLPSSQAGSYHVKLEISFQGPDGSSRLLTNEKDIVLASGSVTAQAKIQKLFASMASVFQQKSVAVYRFALVAAGVIVGVLFFLGLTKRKVAK